MKEDPLNNLSLDDLKKKEKMLKSSVSILIGAAFVLTITGIFITYKQGFSVFTILPIIFGSIAVINHTNLKKLRVEIASRDK